MSTRLDAWSQTLRTLNVWLRPAIQGFLQKNGRYPKSLEEAFPSGDYQKDPVTGTWDYDPETGTIRSPAFPDF